jgi:hypothetical protein
MFLDWMKALGDGDALNAQSARAGRIARSENTSPIIAAQIT